MRTIALTVAFGLAAASADARLWTVGGEGADFPLLAPAIAAASTGDVIRVRGGVYREDLVLNKRLSIRGEGQPLLFGTGIGSVVTITENGCELTGFVIEAIRKIVSTVIGSRSGSVARSPYARRKTTPSRRPITTTQPGSFRARIAARTASSIASWWAVAILTTGGIAGCVAIGSRSCGGSGVGGGMARRPCTWTAVVSRAPSPLPPHESALAARSPSAHAIHFMRRQAWAIAG